MSAAAPGSRKVPLATMDLALALLRERLAPGFPRLIWNPCLPDRSLAVLLAWAEALGTEDPEEALALEALARVLPALNTAFLASFTFAGTQARDPRLRGLKVDLELTDRGNGQLVDQARSCAGLLAAGMHGQAGVALVARTDRALRDAMDAIARAVARRG
jgi:hypothetical protein